MKSLNDKIIGRYARGDAARSTWPRISWTWEAARASISARAPREGGLSVAGLAAGSMIILGVMPVWMWC